MFTWYRIEVGNNLKYFPFRHDVIRTYTKYSSGGTQHTRCETAKPYTNNDNMHNQLRLGFLTRLAVNMAMIKSIYNELDNELVLASHNFVASRNAVVTFSASECDFISRTYTERMRHEIDAWQSSIYRQLWVHHFVV